MKQAAAVLMKTKMEHFTIYLKHRKANLRWTVRPRTAFLMKIVIVMQSTSGLQVMEPVNLSRQNVHLLKYDHEKYRGAALYNTAAPCFSFIYKIVEFYMLAKSKILKNKLKNNPKV
jgi:hypothetical protein